MPHQKVSPFIRTAARRMRRHPIDAEEAVWWRLRRRQLGGLRFRRQHPIGNCIADFVCLEARLIVEVDGSQHDDSHTDGSRTQALRRRGFGIIRFSNDEVRSDLDKVCEMILRAARSRQGTPPSDPFGATFPHKGEG